MSAELDIYNIEGVLEEAFAAVLRARALTVSIVADEAKFQKVRPRAELVAMLQGGQNRPYAEGEPQRPNVGHLREQAYRVQLKADVIADTLENARIYICTIRRRFDKIADEITLTRHYIHSCRNAGSTPAHKPEDGYYRSTMLFDLDVSIQQDAWAELEA